MSLNDVIAYIDVGLVALGGMNFILKPKINNNNNGKKPKSFEKAQRVKPQSLMT